MSSGWIGHDLDGALAEYDGFVDHVTIGKPIPRSVERIQKYLADGIEVRIFTARVYYPEGNETRKREAEEAREAIVKWCEQHIGQPLKVTCTKDCSMWRLYDDRCVQVEANSGRLSVDQAYELGCANGRAEVQFVTRS